MEKLHLNTTRRTELIDITAHVKRFVAESGVKEGICTIYVPHTTAGVTVNEAADPAVGRDLIAALNKLVPFEGDYAHGEGNSAAHIKATMLGSSASVPVSDGRLALGTWQGIFFGEFDGPRSRSACFQLVSAR